MSTATQALPTLAWSVWTTDTRLVVTDPAALVPAHALVQGVLAEVDAAANRFRPTSEVRCIAERAEGRPTGISPMLARLVAFALCAAEQTAGDVDPTVGADLVALGYDGDLDNGDLDHREPAARTGTRAHAARRVTHRDVQLDGTQLRVPAGLLLDLGATAKAWAADTCAVQIAERFGCGALVSLGGDLRVAGPPPETGWQVLVQDGDAEPASSIRLEGANAVATSSTLHRAWEQDRVRMHHILDPRLGRPAAPVWRTATVAAGTCVEANTLSTAAIVRGRGAPDLLREHGVAARLVAADGSVLRVGGWPA